MLLAPLGLLAVAAGHVLVARRAALGGLRRQFSALALLVVAQAAIVVAVFVVRMFVSGHDAFLTAMLVGWASDARALGRLPARPRAPWATSRRSARRSPPSPSAAATSAPAWAVAASWPSSRPTSTR